MSLASKGNIRAKGKKYHLSDIQLEAKRKRMFGNQLTAGINLTQEHKDKISAAHKRIGHETGARMKGNTLRLGKPHSEEERRKMSAGHKPKPNCPLGHPLVGDNLIIAKNGRWRRCRECSRIYARKQRAAQK